MQLREKALQLFPKSTCKKHTRKFAMAYYGWDDIEGPALPGREMSPDMQTLFTKEELPFN
jgi:hypothetical protein